MRRNFAAECCWPKLQRVLPHFSQPLLSAFKLQIHSLEKQSSAKFADTKNLLLPGSLFCHFPHLDSMIRTLETEHGFH